MARRYTPKPKVRLGSNLKRRETATTTTQNNKTRLNRTLEHQFTFEESESSSSSSSSSDEREGDKDDNAKSADGDVVDPPVNQDPFAYVGKTTADEFPSTQGELCELHSYDSRFNSKGEQIVLRTGSKYDFENEAIKSPEAALVLTRYISLGKVHSTSLEIRSPYIKKALKEVIGSYPGVNIDSERSVRLYDKPKCLFHYRLELEKYAEASDDAPMNQHVAFCLGDMERALSKELSIYNSVMAGNTAMPRLNFDELWMAFKPGSLIYMRDQDSEYVYKFRDMDEDEDNRGRRFWALEVDGVESNGKTFGLVERICHIHRFDGYKPLTDLAIFPLVLHPEVDRIREKLLARGKKYVAHSGTHYRMYDGVQKPPAGARSEERAQGVKQVPGSPIHEKDAVANVVRAGATPDHGGRPYI